MRADSHANAIYRFAVCVPDRVAAEAARDVFSRNSSKKEESAVLALSSFLVEPAGIEPASKNPLTQPSPWAVILLDFPLCDAE